MRLLPKRMTRALAALIANPTASDVEIARQLGIGATTVLRTRRKAGIAPCRRGRPRLAKTPTEDLL